MMTLTPEYFMREALAEGRKALPDCLPNPPIGCVLVRDGEIIARGFTNPPGAHHAEAMALSQVSGSVTDVTAYVTLEPCSFQGRTPSCAVALAERGVGAVHAALIDPDPRNNGAGLEILRQAGVHVTLGLLREEAESDLRPYLSQKVLETDRLTLRYFEQEDLDAFAAINANPDVMRFYSSGPRSREETARNITWFIDLQKRCGYSPWAVIHKEENQFLGFCGFLPQTIHGVQEAEIAYRLDKRYWGKGLATEAAQAVRDWGFAHLQVSRLISLIHSENIASIRVAEKNGMKRVDQIEFHGKACEIYAVLRY